jgi:hypothetical protein
VNDEEAAVAAANQRRWGLARLHVSDSEVLAWVTVSSSHNSQKSCDCLPNSPHTLHIQTLVPTITEDHLTQLETTNTHTTAIMADTVRHSEPHVEVRNTLSLPRNVSEPPNHDHNSLKHRMKDLSADTFDSQADTERKPRKSVAFSEGATIVDIDGQVTESKEMNGGKSTAESHSGNVSPPTGEDTWCEQNTGHGLTSGVADEADKDVEEVTDMFADLAKKVRTTHRDTSGA